MSSIRGNIDHKDFQKRLASSSGAVFALAEHFHISGFEVRIPPVHISPERNQNTNYTDDGDLWITNNKGNSHKIEVKWSRQDFTDSWPYPLMWVMDAETWDKIEIKPFGLFTVNANCTHAAVIPIEQSIDSWIKKESHDKFRGCTDLVYACPTSLVSWMKLESHPRQK